MLSSTSLCVVHFIFLLRKFTFLNYYAFTYELNKNFDDYNICVDYIYIIQILFLKYVWSFLVCGRYKVFKFKFKYTEVVTKVCRMFLHYYL